MPVDLTRYGTVKIVASIEDPPVIKTSSLTSKDHGAHTGPPPLATGRTSPTS
jgi:hypothetical protein